MFVQDDVLYREVKTSYRAHYDVLLSSGLYDELTEQGLLVPHETVPDWKPSADTYQILKPERIPFVSYPYEWCFSQLKDAALCTLRIQALAMEHGMTLKDASAYNVQWRDAHPIFIDTLSFETLNDGEPWQAYGQFCRHFLAPLALMAYKDVRLSQLSLNYIDGIPLDLASGLLPKSTTIRPGLALHLHAHAKMTAKHGGGGTTSERKPTMGRNGLRGLIDNLRSTVKGLSVKWGRSEWGDYYQNTNYDDASFIQKGELVRRYVTTESPDTVWDLGANTGHFSAIAAESCSFVASMDIEPEAVERHYLALQDADKAMSVLPLLMNFVNPSPASGWAGDERDSLEQRAPADLLLCLALVHHLAIGNNVPLPQVAKMLASLGNTLVIEFIPKEDSQVTHMLSSREDIFPEYTQAGFETAFSECFTLEESSAIEGTQRRLYRMKKR